MPDELKSFLMSISIILTIALFIPCIESIAKLIRRSSQKQALAESTPSKTAKRLRHDVAQHTAQS